jgi:hypothetical protein
MSPTGQTPLEKTSLKTSFKDKKETYNPCQ